MDVTRDGSPVAVYRALPAAGEPELIHGTIPAGASVLELASGPGRMAEWRQPFVARRRDEAGLRNLLDATGFRFGRWLERPGWFVAERVR